MLLKVEIDVVARRYKNEEKRRGKNMVTLVNGSLTRRPSSTTLSNSGHKLIYSLSTLSAFVILSSTDD